MDTLGYVWICLDTFGYASGVEYLDMALGISLDFVGFSPILQGVPLGISTDFDGFVPILQRIAFRMSLVFYGFAGILQGVPP